VITYDGVPTFSLSVMEFTDGLVTHETQYFADPSTPPPRAPRSLSRFLPATTSGVSTLIGAGVVDPPVAHSGSPALEHWSWCAA
jgi:hypothetical protein